MDNCTLCPRQCKVRRSDGEMGFCSSLDKIKIARADLHHWEEPCISGTRGSGTVFFSGCNMKCLFCQNYSISTLGNGMVITEKELADKFLELQEKGAHNINLVTPTHFVPGIIQSLEIAKNRGLTLPVVYNCGGYENTETIEKLKGYVDIYMPDIKYFSDKYALEYSKAPGYFSVATKALKKMYSQVGRAVFDGDGILKKGVIVRHLMLPTLLFDTKKIVDYLFDTYGDNILFSLMSQYTPMDFVKNHPVLGNRINPKHYESMVDYIVCKGMENVYIQDLASSTDEYIPDFSQAPHQEPS